jgi:cohesin complex subunit SA-1/2
MASCEVELSVRIAAIEVLRLIAVHGLLDDDQIDQLARLIFHVDAKVRKAVAGFFLGLVDETAASRDEDLAASRPSTSQQKGKATQHASAFDDDQRKVCLKLKCLAEAFVKHGKELDAEMGGENTEGDEAEVAAGTLSSRKSRITDAVAALWTVEKDEDIADWQLMADYLILDHSASGDSQVVEAVDDAIRLDDEEESALLEVFVASLQHTRADAESRKVRSRVAVPHSLAWAERTHRMPRAKLSSATSLER